MIRHTLTPLPNGDFILKMTQDGRCIQTTDVTREDIDAMLEVIREKPQDAADTSAMHSPLPAGVGGGFEKTVV